MNTSHPPPGQGHPHSLQMVVVIDHQSARLFRLASNETGAESPIKLVPHDPHGFHRHLVHKKEANYEGERVPEDPAFYEGIAAALVPAHEILIIGHGAGKSNAATHLLEHLKKRHVAVANRVAEMTSADLSHITDGQLLALARTHFAAIDERRRHGLPT